MKLVKLLAVVVLLISACFAQDFITVTASGCIGDASGLVQNGTLTVNAADSNGTPIPFRSGGMYQATTKPVTRAITTGSIASMQLGNPATSRPQNFGYKFVIQDNVTKKITSYWPIVVAANDGANFNFCKYDVAQTITTVPVAYSTSVPLNDANLQANTDAALLNYANVFLKPQTFINAGDLNCAPTDLSSIIACHGARFEVSGTDYGVVVFGNNGSQILKIHMTDTTNGRFTAYVKQSRSAGGAGGGGAIMFQAQKFNSYICNQLLVGSYGTATGGTSYQDDAAIAAYYDAACNGTGSIRFVPPSALANGNPYALVIGPDGSVYFGGDNSFCIGGACNPDNKTANASMQFSNEGTSSFKIRDKSLSAAGKDFVPLQWTRYGSGATTVTIGAGADAVAGASVLDVNGQVRGTTMQVGGETISKSPRDFYSVYLPVTTSSAPLNLALISVEQAMTITQMSFANTTPGVSCGQWPQVDVYDATAGATVTGSVLTIQGGSVNGTPFSTNIPAGHSIYIRLATQALTCSTFPAGVTVTMNHKMQ